MSARQRRKGAAWEREIALYLRSQGLEAKRGIGQARSASEVPDVDLPGWWVEAKRHARTNPKAALAQAVADAEEHGGGRVPVAICRDNGTPLEGATVTLRLADWVALVRDRRSLDRVAAAASAATRQELEVPLLDATRDARAELAAEGVVVDAPAWLAELDEVLP